MRYQSILAIFFTLAIAAKAHGQSEFKHAVFFELGGNGYWYSLNYERQINRGLIARAGVCYIPTHFVVPVMIGKLFSWKSHHFDLSGGLDYAYLHERWHTIPRKVTYLALTSFLGYRYQRPDQKFFCRVGFTPIWEFYNSDPKTPDISPFYAWGGVGAGVRFTGIFRKRPKS
jgi:hypothetical protein